MGWKKHVDSGGAGYAENEHGERIAKCWVPSRGWVYSAFDAQRVPLGTSKDPAQANQMIAENRGDE